MFSEFSLHLFCFFLTGVAALVGYDLYRSYSRLSWLEKFERTVISALLVLPTFSFWHVGLFHLILHGVAIVVCLWIIGKFGYLWLKSPADDIEEMGDSEADTSLSYEMSVIISSILILLILIFSIFYLIYLWIYPLAVVVALILLALHSLRSQTFWHRNLYSAVFVPITLVFVINFALGGWEWTEFGTDSPSQRADLVFSSVELDSSQDSSPSPEAPPSSASTVEPVEKIPVAEIPVAEVPQIQPTVGFVDGTSQTAQTSTETLRSVPTELKVEDGETEVVKYLTDVSGAEKHQEALRDFFFYETQPGKKPQFLVEIEGDFKDGEVEITTQLSGGGGSTLRPDGEGSHTYFQNGIISSFQVIYTGKRKLSFTLSVPTGE